MATFTIPIQITWTGASGNPGVNVFHARSDSLTTDPETLTEILHDFYETIKEIYTGSVDIDFLGELQGVGDDTGDVATAPSWHVDGGPASDFLPPANCILVNWRTPTGGRSGRGRTFLGPLNTFQSEGNGTPNETARPLVQGAADDLISASEGFSNGALGVYSRTDNVFRDFVSASVPNKFAVLRSRRD